MIRLQTAAPHNRAQILQREALGCVCGDVAEGSFPSGRLLFAFARDRMIVGHKVWSRISEKSEGSTAALIACGVMSAIIAIVGYLKTDALTAIVSFAAIGIYIAFQDRSWCADSTSPKVETLRKLYTWKSGQGRDDCRAWLWCSRNRQHRMAESVRDAVVYQLQCCALDGSRYIGRPAYLLVTKPTAR